jgi:type II secretory pathway component PulF
MQALADNEGIKMKIRSIVATVLALIAAGMIAAVWYLAFVFPKTLEVWQDQYEGQSLSGLQILVANASHFCSSFGLVLLPILVLAFVAALVWPRVVTVRSKIANRTNGE